jgi:hypothetical protein
MKPKATTILAAAALAVSAALAPASALADFGFAKVNAPGGPPAPAFPGETAVWSGTCDLSSASTANGGVGPASGGIEPPALRRNCIDTGTFSSGAENSSWLAGGEPRWRLDPVAQAGAHPDGTAAFWFQKQAGSGNLDGYVRDVVAHLPPGLVGNPTAVPQCPAAEAQFIPPVCSGNTQVGIATLQLGSSFGERGYPVYNVEARDTVTAEFTIGNVASEANVPVTARSRTNGDFGVDALAVLIPTVVPVYGQAFTFWGVPWAASHDPYRIRPEYNWNSAPTQSIPAGGVPVPDQAPYEPSWGSIEPFFSNPTHCQGSPLTVGFDVDSWENPAPLLADGSPDSSDPRWKTASVETPILSGCDKLGFSPALALHPTVEVADSPSGVDVTLETPQNNSPKDEAGAPLSPPAAGASAAAVQEYVAAATAYWKSDAGLATSHLKDTTVVLPQGTSFNPGAANGLQGCATEEIGLTSAPGATPVSFDNETVACPDSSKIGTVRIDTPLLPKPLLGTVYVAPQGDNPFPGSLTAIYLVVQDEERGLSVKLAGRVDLDQATGQITTTFANNPQLPFGKFELHFEDGPRAPLSTPTTCGQFETASSLVPWSLAAGAQAPAPLQSPFAISSMPNGLGCVGRPQDRVFKPAFDAGALSRGAASHTDFALNVVRRDGEQEVSGLALDMPPGLVASLKGVQYCSQAQIDAAKARSGQAETLGSSCPAGSYVGKVDALAGTGSTLLHAPGRLYLAGPYDADGAGPKPASPVSVVTVVPAIAGGTPGDPAFDLGNVVVRTGVNVDPESAQVHVDSARVPYIFGGVPLRVRRISVDLDRPDFMLNPSNCDPFEVGATIAGAANPLDPGDDVAVAAANGFQAEGCKALGFRPKLSLTLSGGTRRGEHPALRAVVDYPPGGGYANVKSAVVALPHSEFLEQAHINTICTRVQFAAKQCPKGSIYGHARAFSPLLGQPLEGPVYLRSSSHQLPDLVVALRGPDSQPIEVVLVGRVDSVNAGIRNSFEAVPDAPVEKFILTMKGGNKGLLVNSTNICTKTKVTRKHGRKVSRTVRATNAADAIFIAQSGKALHQKAPIKASGCSKAKKHKKGKRHH